MAATRPGHRRSVVGARANSVAIILEGNVPRRRGSEIAAAMDHQRHVVLDEVCHETTLRRGAAARRATVSPCLHLLHRASSCVNPLGRLWLAPPPPAVGPQSQRTQRLQTEQRTASARRIERICCRRPDAIHIECSMLNRKSGRRNKQGRAEILQPNLVTRRSGKSKVSWRSSRSTNRRTSLHLRLLQSFMG